jgi:hypothetical protein
MTLISALVHEIGHLAPAFYKSSSALSLPRGDLSGFRILKCKKISYREELGILIFGPLFNLLFSFALIVLGLFFGDYFFLFAAVSLMTMISNLLPIRGYDGYKIIHSLICLSKPDPTRDEKILNATSFFLSTLILFISLYFLLRLGAGYWIFALILCEVVSAIHSYNSCLAE